MIRSVLSLLILLYLPGILLGQSHSSHPIDAINPPLGGEFPGNRGTNELNVYTFSGLRESTGTNRYGSEAVVVDGIVESVGENDNTIPANGFVISGHGTAARWINSSLAPGAAVYFTKSSVRIDDSPRGRLISLRHRLSEIEEELAKKKGEEAKSLSTKAGKASGLIDEAMESASQDAVSQAADLLDEIERDLWSLTLENMPSPEGEIRAVWHRLAATSREEIASLAQAWADAGVNVAFPETIYASQAIYTDPTGLYTKFPQLGDMDALEVLIEECHARGIEVHAWVHCFFIGIEGNEKEPALLAARRPEWLAEDRQGRHVSDDEPGYMYFSPAMPEVRSALMDAYKALAENYEIDGFQFDYIRYCGSDSWEDQWDYSDYTRKTVEEELGFDPMEINPDDDQGKWKQWMSWREETITSFVRETAKTVRAVDSELILTADVFPDLESAIRNKGQNWAEWGREGYVDSIIPMAYTTSAGEVAASVREMDDLLPEDAPLVIGLGPYLGFSPRQLIRQVEATRRVGATGQSLFAWDAMTPAMKADLGRGPWKQPTRPDWTSNAE